MASKNSNQRVQKFRDEMRRIGFRPVQMWLPDPRKPGFTKECKRQLSIVGKADALDADLILQLEQTAATTDGWR